MHILVWTKVVAHDNIKKAEYKLKYGTQTLKQDLTNHSDYTYSSVVDLSALGYIGSATIEINVEENRTKKIYKEVIEINMQ